MKIARTKSELEEQINILKDRDPSAKVGFIPTMGALHKGHLALVTSASDLTDIIVVSIFVNPTQFNNQEDLINYPRTVDKDIELLSETSCKIVFLPSEAEVYSTDYSAAKVDLNGLDKVMEGASRPGHFEGVVNVVNRLFELVNPDLAFFGKKDFQQLAIIKQMVNKLYWPIEIVPVEIKRSVNGLALSSRNSRLNEAQKKESLIIINTLRFGSDLAKKADTVSSLKEQMIDFFNQGELNLEYIEIADPVTLQPADNLDNKTICCIVAHCGDVRLIDNMEFSRD